MGADEAPETPGADVTEGRTGTKCEHCRHEATVLADVRMTDGEHTAMKRVKTPGRDAPTACVIADAEIIELRRGDHPVLTCRNLRDFGVRSAWVAISPHVGR